MAPPGRLELRDRMCPSSALQDCAWLLCRVNQSQPWVLSGAPSHCSSSDLSAVPLFIFHSFEKHLSSTFHVPSNWLGAESTPGTLLHTPRSTHTQSPGPGPDQSLFSNSELHVETPTPNAYSGLSSFVQKRRQWLRGISGWAEQSFIFSNSLSSFISGISSGFRSTPIQILQRSVQMPPPPWSLPWSHLSLDFFGTPFAPLSWISSQVLELLKLKLI